jgi:hypothetical protein
MRKLFLIALLLPLLSLAQSETHDFKMDTVIFKDSYNGTWGILCWHPKDTIARPAIAAFPGAGEMGVSSISNAAKFGPMYWLQNGWDGSVVLGNGTHYPIILGLNYYTNPAPNPNAVYQVLAYVAKTFHVKPGSFHIAGLSNGAGAVTSIIPYELTPGGEDGMKLVRSVFALSGSVDIFKDSVKWKTFATKYDGRYSGTEGYGDVMRATWRAAKVINSVKPNTAYFSYNTVAGGGHGGWNTLYDPKMTDWRTDPVGKGTYYSPSQGGQFGAGGIDNMGNHKYPESMVQWMLRQGDTTFVAAVIPNKPPVASAGSPQTITLPTNQVTLDCSGSYDPDGKISGCVWSVTSAPSGATVTIANGIASGLTAADTYVFTLQVTDDKGATSTAKTTITVNPAPKVVLFSIKLIDGKTFTLYADGSYTLV